MDITTILISIIVLLVSLSIHEMAHAIASYLLGDDTAKLQQRISLNPLRHLDPFLSVILPITLLLLNMPIFGGAKPVMIDRRRIKWGDYGIALVALAGPVSNLILAFVSYGLFVVGMQFNNELMAVIFWISTNTNLAIMFFNLVPIPPLDGSRVLSAIAPLSIQEVLYRIETQGLMLVFLIVTFANGVVGLYIKKMAGLMLDLFEIIFSLFL